MSSSLNKSVNVERRTWDKETFEARARARAAAEKEADADPGEGAGAAPAAADGEGTAGEGAALKKELDPEEEKEEFRPAQEGRAGPLGSERAFLVPRARRVDLEAKLGTSELIDPAAASVTRAAPLTPASGVTKCTDGVGWHCRVCDCFLKDSLTYLDHINGRKHQRHLGYSMRAEKSTAAEVGGLLRGLAEDRQKRDVGARCGAPAVVDFEDAVRQKDAEALRRKAARARRREERKRLEREGACGAGSGSGTNGEAGSPRAEVPSTGGGDPAEKGREEGGVDEDEGGIDPNLAAMMGFSGFGGSRKK